MTRKISVVIPAYNEEGNILELTDRVARVLRDLPHEILFVDDGSTDHTLALIKAVQKRYLNINYLSFTRNFGHQNALRAGLDYATGACVITLDADLQHPPEMIPELIERWRTGYAIVNTERRDEACISLFKRITAKWFYRLINLIAEVHIREGSADFRLLDRAVVDVLKTMDEGALFYRGIIPWTGFRQISVPYSAAKRFAGKSKYAIGRMTCFALNGLVSFSILPLRLATVLGLLMAVSGFIIGAIAIYEVIFTARTVPGWASTIVSVVFVGGVQLLILGIIGEYLGRVFIETKKRPPYILQESSVEGQE